MQIGSLKTKSCFQRFERPFRLSWRWFWLVVLLGHLPAFYKVIHQWVVFGTEKARLSSVSALLLACIFFLFKWLDVSWLRFKTDRRSVLSLMLACALMHTDVVQSANHDSLVKPVALMLSGSLGAGQLLVVDRLIQHITRLMVRLFVLTNSLPTIIRTHLKNPEEINPSFQCIPWRSGRAPPSPT